MSQQASQQTSTELSPRSRVPRIAEAAVERARLTVVPRRAGRAPRVPFVALVSLLLVGGVAGLLLFNTSMQQASFRATALEQHAQVLAAQEQSLQMELETLRDPQRVATEARRIGMVPPANPAFIRLSDGQVLGNPTPAVPEDGIRVAPLPAQKPKVLRPDVVIVPAKTGRDDDGAASPERDDRAGTKNQRDREGRAAGQQGSDR
jgi:outer membrane biosynthesis protein TonB